MSNVLYSTVSTASEWPRQVVKITKFLTDELPSGLLSSSPGLSSVTAPLWNDVVQTRWATINGIDVSTPVSDEMFGMLEHLLYPVALVQSLKASVSNARELRPAVSLLLHVMGGLCLPKLQINGERRFALSRYTKLGGTVGQVFKLMSVMSIIEELEGDDVSVVDIKDAIPDVESEQDTIPAVQSDEDVIPAHESEGNASSSSSSASTHDSDSAVTDSDSAVTDSDSAVTDSDSTSTDSSSSHSPNPRPNIISERHPADIHFLDVWHDQKSWICPFICMTDESYIREAMVSAACQRFDWRICEPVVGLALMEDGTSIQIYFAWAEPSHLEDSMPLVRVVSTLCLDATMGVYDLSDPLSTLLFAQFLLSLRSTADTFSDVCRNSQYDYVKWRADSAIEEKSLAPYSNGISGWIQDVQASLPDSAHNNIRSSSPSTSVASGASSHPASLIMMNSSSSVHQTRGVTGSSGSTKSSGTKATVPIATTPSQSKKLSNIPAQVRTSQTPPVSVISQSEAPTRPSASVFCTSLEDHVATQEASIGSFLHERHVIEVARVTVLDYPLPKPGAVYDSRHAVQEINDMVTEYDQLTCYTPLPKGFLDQEIVATTDSRLTKSNFMALRTALSKQVANFDSESPVTVMTAPLSSLLYTVQTARNVKAEGANEAEARHSWDSLISMSFVADGELASPRLRLEKTLPLSRNLVYDDTKLNSPKAVRARLSKNSTLNSGLAGEARNWVEEPLTEALEAQLQAGVVLAAHRILDISGLRAENISQLVRRHAQAEVYQAKCDSFLGFPGPLLANFKGQFTQSILHLKPPKKPKADSHSDSAPDAESEWESGSGSEAEADSKSPLPPVLEEALNESAARAHAPEINPFIASATETCPLHSAEGLLSDEVISLYRRIILPVFAGEYKRPGEEFLIALRRLKLYLTSAVAFLASLSIKGYPVYGLATNGTVGVVLSAWRSKNSEYTYIMDRNVRSFDLSSPIEMYQFATFMTRLRKWSDATLTALVVEHIGLHEPKLNFRQETWTKEAQINAYKKELTPKDTKKKKQPSRARAAKE